MKTINIYPATDKMGQIAPEKRKMHAIEALHVVNKVLYTFPVMAK